MTSADTESRPRSVRAAVLAVLGHRMFVPACFVLHMGLRALLAYIAPVEPDSDGAWYYNRGIGLASGDGYVRADGSPTAFWPVGYPAFLGALFWLFGPSMAVVKSANLVLSAATFFLALGFARRCASETVARIAVLALAIYPNSIAYVSLPLSETLFTALLLLGFLLYTAPPRVWRTILCGFTFGLATFVKAQGLVVAPVMVGFAFLFPKSTRFRLPTIAHGLLLGVVMAGTIAPWTIRNYYVFDTFVPVSTNAWIGLLACNNPAMKPDFKRNFNADHPIVHATGHPHDPEILVSARAKVAVKKWISENPDKFIALIPHKIWRLWGPDGEAEWGFQSHPFYEPNKIWFRAVRILNQGYYALLMFLALAFPFVRSRSDRPARTAWIWLSWALAGYFTLVSIAFSGQSRYHAPMMPLIIINSAYVVATWLTRAERKLAPA